MNGLSALRFVIPPLTSTNHKGSAGRIGVIGGSLEYTGAPYFAAISAMKSGADLCHVFCPEDAAPVIKSYSPELIVHPLLSSKSSEEDTVRAITSWFPRLHSLVIGPGLGRDPVILRRVKEIIAVAKRQQKNIIIDADGLFLITQDFEVIRGYKKAILTPNGGEFPKLYESVFGDYRHGSLDSREETKSLAARLGGVTVVRKGKIDVISDGQEVLCCDEGGCMRRCGGQGDVLSGITGLFSFWTSEKEEQLSSKFGLSPTMVAAYGGCFMTKKCAAAAFAKRHRSMLAQDLVNEIASVYHQHFGQNSYDDPCKIL